MRSRILTEGEDMTPDERERLRKLITSGVFLEE